MWEDNAGSLKFLILYFSKLIPMNPFRLVVSGLVGSFASQVRLIRSALTVIVVVLLIVVAISIAVCVWHGVGRVVDAIRSRQCTWSVRKISTM